MEIDDDFNLMRQDYFLLDVEEFKNSDYINLDTESKETFINIGLHNMRCTKVVHD